MRPPVIGRIQRLVGGLERSARVGMIEDVSHARREGNLAEGLVIVPVDQTPLGEALAQPVKALLGFGKGASPEEHHKFLAAMA